MKLSMHRKLPGLSTLGAAALAFTFGCQGSGSFAKLNESLAQIQEQQKEILAKLGELEGKIGEAGPAPAKPGQPDKARPRPGRPDPSATYKVPVGDAQTKGPETAKVTIVEWSDFQ